MRWIHWPTSTEFSSSRDSPHGPCRIAEPPDSYLRAQLARAKTKEDGRTRSEQEEGTRLRDCGDLLECHEALIGCVGGPVDGDVGVQCRVQRRTLRSVHKRHGGGVVRDAGNVGQSPRGIH